MKWLHCPRTFRRQLYGCGFGPVSYTRAFPDYSLHCPQCGKALKELRNTPRQRMAALQEHLDTLGFVSETQGPDALSRYAASHRPRIRCRKH